MSHLQIGVSVMDSPTFRRHGAPPAVALLLSATLTGCFLGGGPSGDVAPRPDAGAEADALLEERTAERNARLRALADDAGGPPSESTYRIGTDDLLDIQVFGVEELSASTRVTTEGQVSLPLLGPVNAAGLTPPELARSLENRLQETYMRDPRVSVQVLEMRSRSVSVVGAVNSPGVYEISGPRRLLQVLALAEGLSPQAGGSVMVVRDAPAAGPPPAAAATAVDAEPSDAGAADDAASDPGATDVTPGDGPSPPAVEPAAVSPPRAVDEGAIAEVDLRMLLESGDPGLNVMVNPGDVVQVRPAGMVYVVGDVNQPGGFPLDSGEPLSVLQAVAVAEGLTPTASAGDALIMRPGPDGRQEIPVDVGRVLSGEQPDVELEAQDILFIPNSTTRSVARGILDAFVRMATLRGFLN